MDIKPCCIVIKLENPILMEETIGFQITKKEVDTYLPNNGNKVMTLVYREDPRGQTFPMYHKFDL